MIFLDSPDKTSDETLILRYRLGDNVSYDILVKRYFSRKNYCIRNCGKDYIDILDEWETNEIFFRSFICAVDSFLCNSGLFRSFFNLILGRELTREAVKSLKYKASMKVVSIDEFLDEEDEFTLGDILCSSMYDDPRIYYSTNEPVDRFTQLAGMPKEGYDYWCQLREGSSIREISSKNNTTIARVKYCLHKFRTWLKGCSEAQELLGLNSNK